MRTHSARALWTAALALVVTLPLAARQAPAPRALPDISGIWTRVDTEGGQSYDGIAFPQAELLPEFTAKLRPPQFEGHGTPPPGWTPPVYDIAGQGTVPRCAVGGGGAGAGGGNVNINSSGMALMATRDLVLMLRDGAQGARYMYADARPFPARLNGLYSVGRWDEDVFMVTTRGFNPGMTAFGRGWMEPTTELTERFRLEPGGNRLVITYTWTDPKVYVRPHVYDMAFDRLPANQYVFESWCNSKDWIAAN